MKTNKSGWTLLASSGTLESIKNQITRYFYGSEKELIPLNGNEKEWNVKGANGIIPHFRVIKKQNRFRFEMKPTK